MYHRAHLIDIYHIQRMLAFSVIICALFKPHQRKLGFCCTLCSINSWVHYIHAERTVGVVCTRTILKWKFRCCCYAATVILNQSAGRLRLLARKWWWTLTVHGSLRGVVVTHCSCKTRKFSSQLRSSRSNWFGKGSIHLHRKLIRKHPSQVNLYLPYLYLLSAAIQVVSFPTPPLLRRRVWWQLSHFFVMHPKSRESFSARASVEVAKLHPGCIPTALGSQN